MASGDIIYADIVEETLTIDVGETEVIEASLSEEEITVDMAEEEITVDIAPETITAEVSDGETIEADVVICGTGGSGGGAGAGQLFVTDVDGAGIVSLKQYIPDTVPADKVLTECSTDNDSCTIHFLAEGGLLYSPKITLDSVECTNLQEVPGDIRLFTGSFDVTVDTTKTFVLRSSSGTSTSVTINRAAAGPEILSCVIGAYPGVQTAAKAGDTITVTGTVEPEATHVRLLDFEAFDASGWIACAGGAFSISGTVSNESGLNGARVQARNSFGTEGGTFDSSNDITLDQTIPQFTLNGVTFPIGQFAFKDTEAGSVNIAVSDFTSLTYSSPHGDFNIVDPSTYVQDKPITCTNPGDYNDSSTNYRIVAEKASNGTQNTYNLIIEVADTAPIITVGQPVARLRSSEAGEDYVITATSDQNLASAPDIGIPVSGTWQGAGFTGGLKVYNRTIRIDDDDVKGTAAWAFNSVPTNRAGLSASISGDQVVGGFVSRDIALAAFASVSNLGTVVVDTAKLSLTWSFKPNMVFQAIGTSPPVVNGWTIDATGINPTQIIILDTSAAAASSQESTLTIEESI